MSKRKALRLARALAVNRTRPSVPFLRVLPTDYCNLKCAYCWQHTADKRFLPLAEFDACLERALRLDVGLLSFLGGEPLLWSELPTAIRHCTDHHLYTDITTNGSLLNDTTLGRLLDAGLDLLNISVDGLTESGVSKKCSLANPALLKTLGDIHRSGAMKVRVNAVICRNNRPFLHDLVKLTTAHGFPISLGYAMHRTPADFDPAIHFGPESRPELADFLADLRSWRKAGAKIIDPDAYFEGYDRFLARESFWQCNYATRRGWINVDPRGRIRDCTKKFNDLGHRFASLERDDLPALRRRLADGVSACNRDCYSNCAFNGAYFAKHKLRLLATGVI